MLKKRIVIKQDNSSDKKVSFSNSPSTNDPLIANPPIKLDGSNISLDIVEPLTVKNNKLSVNTEQFAVKDEIYTKQQIHDKYLEKIENNITFSSVQQHSINDPNIKIIDCLINDNKIILLQKNIIIVLNNDFICKEYHELPQGKWKHIIYCNQYYLIVSSVKGMISKDLITWKEIRHFPSGIKSITKNLYKSSKNEEICIVIGNSTKECSNISFSTDMINWTTIKLNDKLKKVVCNGKSFLTIGKNVCLRSTDGKRWNYIKQSPITNYVDIDGNDGIFYALDGQQLKYSTDGCEWEIVKDFPTFNWKRVIAGNGLLVFGNNKYTYSLYPYKSTNNWTTGEMVFDDKSIVSVYNKEFVIIRKNNILISNNDITISNTEDIISFTKNEIKKIYELIDSFEEKFTKRINMLEEILIVMANIIGEQFK